MQTWTIKGVSDRTRGAVHEASRAEELTVEEWIDRALAKAFGGSVESWLTQQMQHDLAQVQKKKAGEIDVMRYETA